MELLIKSITKITNNESERQGENKDRNQTQTELNCDR